MTDAVEITGADVVCERLRADGVLTAIVPVEKIKAGALPENIELPAILVLVVTSIDRETLAREGPTRFIDRIEVKVRATSYRQQRRIIGLIGKAVPVDYADAIAGAERVSILKAGRGPDLRGPGGSFDQSRDFRASGEIPA